MKTTNPSAQVISAAQMLIAAMAHEDTIRPIVEAYENAILAKHQWHIAPEYMVEFEMSDRVILNREDAYLLGSANIAEFYKECVAQRAAKGLHASHPDGCPLLEAKHHRFQAEKELLKVMGTMPGLEPLTSANDKAASSASSTLLSPQLPRITCAMNRALASRICQT